MGRSDGHRDERVPVRSSPFGSTISSMFRGTLQRMEHPKTALLRCPGGPRSSGDRGSGCRGSRTGERPSTRRSSTREEENQSDGHYGYDIHFVLIEPSDWDEVLAGEPVVDGQGFWLGGTKVDDWWHFNEDEPGSLIVCYEDGSQVYVWPVRRKPVGGRQGTGPTERWEARHESDGRAVMGYDRGMDPPVSCSTSRSGVGLFIWNFRLRNGPSRDRTE